MASPPETDAEKLEYARSQMQTALERALEALAIGKTLRQHLHDEGETALRVFEPDLREIGSFYLDGPLPKHMLRQWVYEHRETKSVYVLALKTRLVLRERGYADMPTLIHNPNEAS